MGLPSGFAFSRKKATKCNIPSFDFKLFVFTCHPSMMFLKEKHDSSSQPWKRNAYFRQTIFSTENSSRWNRLILQKNAFFWKPPSREETVDPEYHTKKNKNRVLIYFEKEKTLFFLFTLFWCKLQFMKLNFQKSPRVKKRY